MVPLIPIPIRKVLSSIRENEVQALLMGGQACVLYGAAEFSRDADYAVWVDPENLDRLDRALAELQAECIAVPPYEVDYLSRGHAIHFRCQHPEAKGMRIVLIAKMRGVESFEKLWKRRSTLELPDGLVVDVMALPDLVCAKKTQRDKDWPMIRRLLEAHYFSERADPSSEQIDFWLHELRSPELLKEVAEGCPERAQRMSGTRPAVAAAVRSEDTESIGRTLRAEEDQERAKDREYWMPLLEELSQLRRKGRS